jgi:DNA modification methylase
LKWKSETRQLKELINNEKNPRKLSKADALQLQTSLEKFGVCEPIVINWNGEIIGGHQRVRTLKKMGHKEVQVYVPDSPLSEQEANELNIRLNKNIGVWDYDVLANNWEPSDLIEWGFTEEELNFDIDTVDAAEEESDGLLKPTSDPKTKLGDVYQLGNHRLKWGDSTNPDDVTSLLDGAEPVLMVTDPPYGVEYDASWRSVAGKGKRATGKVQNDEQVNWALAWHLFPGSVAYIWHAAWFCSEVHRSLEEAEFQIISQIIWVKQHFAISRGDYHWQHEPCWYAHRKGHKHNWQGSRKETTLWEIGNLNAFGGEKEEERTSHSTQKPIECMMKPIKNNTAKGEGIYDPFCGSGTTLIAAEISGRNAYCMELDPPYCDLIVNRWIRHQKKQGQDFKIILNGDEIDWKETSEG